MRHILVSIFACLSTLAAVAQAPQVVVTTTETVPGKEWGVTVAMLNPNANDIAAIQLDMTLPSGITLKEGTLKTGSRAYRHLVTGSILYNGKLRLVCYSEVNASYTGKKGNIMTFTLQADGEPAEGTYEQEVSNIRISRLDYGEEVLSDVTYTLSVSSPDLVRDELEAAPARTLIYQVNGVMSSRMQRGLNIIRQIMPDGSVRVRKVLR